MRQMLALALSLLVSCLLGEGTSAQQRSSITGPTVLTITGAISNTNRGPFNDIQDTFSKFYDQDFKNAYAFDLKALRELRAKGPPLPDVLKAAEADTKSSLMILGLDGFTKELMPADVANHEWILALEVDDKPLGLGGHGPAWPLYDSSGKPVSTEEAGTWVWSVFSFRSTELEALVAQGR